MTIQFTIEDMMNAGAHFGHQTKRWNPKMRPFLYGQRSGIHIIDLEQTHKLTNQTLEAAIQLVAEKGDILFVGTKPQAQAIVEEQATKAKMPYVKKRWLGGMLTNFVTIRRSVDRLIEMETKRENNDFQGYTKKELLGIDREIIKLKETLGGIKFMNNLPSAVFLVDSTIEKIAVHEAKLLGIPVFAMIDSNADPDPIDFPIPANDDALSSIQLFTSLFAQACLKGLEKREALALELEKEKEKEAKKATPKKKTSRKVEKVETKGEAYVAKTSADEEASAEDVDSFTASPTKDEESNEKASS